MDDRLYPLLRALDAAGLAWLARELRDGIETGHVATEPAEALAEARTGAERPLQDGDPVFLSDGEELEKDDEPFTPEEQLDFAAEYITARLKCAIESMSASLENVETLIAKSAAERSPVPDGVLQLPVELTLIEGERTESVNSNGLAAGLEGLATLKQALQSWRHDQDPSEDRQ